ncbi:MAG: DUF3300 domain-containing protein [Deltaproteobacteria bacterium]
MFIKKLQRMILVIVLTAALISGVALAQDDAVNSSNRTFSQEELAQMLAPVALYPDALLSQILMAATYPFEVVEAERWVTRNPYVTGDQLDDALQSKDWDVSVLALCHYPKILTMMSENLSWTARLGDAFTSQEEEVMDAVQELRARARAAGNLSTTPEQKVVVEERYIYIEPAHPDYFYVPAYDPYVVYGSWWLPLFPPLPIFLPGLIVTGPHVIFSPRFYVRYGVFGWSRFDWHRRSIVIVDIDRTRRYNRRYRDYRGPDHGRWRPDHERRYVRERRRDEIPKFHPPTQPGPPDGRRWDRKPGEPDKRRVPPGRPDLRDRDKRDVEERRSGPGIVPPSRDDKDRRPDVKPPRVIDRDKRDVEERRSGPGIVPPSRDDKDRRPDVKTPRVIDRDKRDVEERRSVPGVNPPRVKDGGIGRPQDRRIPERDKPVEQPRIIERDRPQPPESRPIEKGQPVIRDRSQMEGSEPRHAPQGGQREFMGGAPRSNDNPGRGGMNREGRR